MIHFFNYYGYYVGTYYPREHLNSGYMILKQAEYYLNEEERMVLARLFIDGSVRNILNVLRYYKNRGKDLKNIEEHIVKLSNEIENCNSTTELMAIEGNIRETYYQSFDIIIDNENFRFEKGLEDLLRII